MKVLIVGGTGLISTAITKQLLERGDSVTLFNRGKTPSRVPEGARVMHGDRKEYAAFESAMSKETWDAVIDMVGFVPEDAESAVRAFRGRVSSYVYCSTVCVYNGQMTRTPALDDERLDPLSDYGRNKAACERILMQAFDKEHFPATILRPSQTYGEGGVIIHSLGWSTTYIDRIRKGKPVIVHGDGKTLWASCHIDDVARAFVGACGNPKAVGESYHVTGDDAQNWDDYTHSVAEAVGGFADIVHIPTDLLARISPKRCAFTQHEFQYNRVFDNSKAKRDLGFEYTIPFVEGVKRTVAWLDVNDRIVNSDDDPFDDKVVSDWRQLSAALALVHGEPP
jgi:nucleoside-diphosphate-sugar epimerase